MKMTDMPLLLRRASLLTVLMLAAAVLALFLTPTITQHAGPLDLDGLIPEQFGNWRMEERAGLEIVNPQLKETLKRIYTQTLTRTYLNKEGRRIMLSLAYGADQSNENRVHRPELCYPAQGFVIDSRKKDVINIKEKELPVMRIVADAGSRREPLTYWIRFGDSVIRGSVEQSVARISYGLRGTIPDGLLFRVSEVNNDIKRSFELQDEFIHELLKHVSPEAKKVLVGSTD